MISSFKKQLKGAVILGALLMGSNAFAQLGLQWGEMGPNDIAGRCRSILVDKTDPTGNKMYAAGVSGGVFKSTNGGSTWSPVNDQAPSLIVSCMDQDLSGNIYFGTGETFGTTLDGAGSSGFLGSGLFKIAANSTIITPLQPLSMFGNVNEIAVSGSTIYVAGDAGFFISTDGGFNFTEETISATSTLSPLALDVKIAKNGDVYYSSYAATTSSTGVSYVYYCPFGSTTFSNVTPSSITSINRGRIEIAPSPVDANYVYLSVAKFAGQLGAVLVSDNKASTWAMITLGTAQFDPFLGTGNHANTIVADPIKVDACYLGGYFLYGWNQIAGNDLGQGTWVMLTTPVNIPFAIYVHSGVHDIKFNGGNNSMYVATDGGVFKSVSNNSGFLPYNNGLNISQFNSVAFPIFPRTTQSTNTLSPYAGVGGGTMGNDFTYMPGNFINNVQTSTSFGTSDAYQSDFSRILPKALFYAGANGEIFRTNDVESSALPSTFYDNSYKGAATGGPGASTFANKETPFRLWENYNSMDSAIFYNEVISSSAANYSSTKTTFTIGSTRPQESAKYDSILIKATSLKKVGLTFLATSTNSNTNTTATTFTVANTRPNAAAKYDSIIIKTSSTKMIAPPANQTITIKVLSYYGSMPATYNVTGNANNSPNTNNMIFANSSLSDSIRFTFNTAPDDSSLFSIRVKYKYYQNIIITPVYSGTTITACNVMGDANTSSASNNTVFINSNLLDSVRYKFAVAPDSATLVTDFKFRYAPGDVISLLNSDISGNKFTATTVLTSSLSTNTNQNLATVKVPLSRSGRFATGITNTSPSTGPSIFAVKRPLNFSINPDWVKIAGKNSRLDGPGGVASTVQAAITGTTITRIEWAPSGTYLYFSTKLNNSQYFLYRVSHINFLGDSAAEDFTGRFSSDIDSTNGFIRKSNPIRTTPIGMFPDPITGIAVSADDQNLMVTCGGYFNTAGTVYYSNSDVRALNSNTVNTSNFSAKNGSGLPYIPAYSAIFEMSDNKIAIVGTETGVYSTMDITAASPSWNKETGTAPNIMPNVPVFQIRQQTFPKWLCYNSGVIYAATHGRGIWSTDKYFAPYAIGIEEQEQVGQSFSSNIKLFPNPASDATTLWFKAAGDANYKVTVYDINGRILIQQTTAKLMEGEQTLHLNTSELTSGVYFVTVNGSNNFSANSKLIITR